MITAARLVRSARGRAGLTQRSLAKRARLAQPTIAAIESGRHDPRYRTLTRLVAACEQELDLLRAAGRGVDRTQFRTTLRLSPAERLRRAAAGARTLRRLRSARRVT